jgi:hypothetical protein
MALLLFAMIRVAHTWLSPEVLERGDPIVLLVHELCGVARARNAAAEALPGAVTDP